MIYRDLSGCKFGMLTVTGSVNYNGRLHWICRCDCGHDAFVRSDALKRKNVSCGCVRRRIPPSSKKRHGLSGTPENVAWLSMIRRCTNPKQKNFDRYGGRGISVCDRWLFSFEAFLADMGKKPTSGHTLERKDNNGNYEQSNRCWIPKAEQQLNTRRNRFIKHDGERLTLSQWAKRLGVPRERIADRLNRGAPASLALNPDLLR